MWACGQKQHVGVQLPALVLVGFWLLVQPLRGPAVLPVLSSLRCLCILPGSLHFPEVRLNWLFFLAVKKSMTTKGGTRDSTGLAPRVPLPERSIWLQQGLTCSGWRHGEIEQILMGLNAMHQGSYQFLKAPLAAGGRGSFLITLESDS